MLDGDCQCLSDDAKSETHWRKRWTNRRRRPNHPARARIVFQGVALIAPGFEVGDDLHSIGDDMQPSQRNSTNYDIMNSFYEARQWYWTWNFQIRRKKLLFDKYWGWKSSRIAWVLAFPVINLIHWELCWSACMRMHAGTSIRFFNADVIK